MTPAHRTETEVCQNFITPAVEAAGWDKLTQIRREYTFTAGRVIVRGKLASRGKKKRADYVLFYESNLPLPAALAVTGLVEECGHEERRLEGPAAIEHATSPAADLAIVEGKKEFFDLLVVRFNRLARNSNPCDQSRYSWDWTSDTMNAAPGGAAVIDSTSSLNSTRRPPAAQFTQQGASGFMESIRAEMPRPFSADSIAFAARSMQCPRAPLPAITGRIGA